MTGVPDRYRGVWARRLLETPDRRDDSTFVRWLQTSAWHADLRVPDGSAEADAPIALASQQGFCGVTEISSSPQGEICTWIRRYDFQPPRGSVDAGLMVFEDPDRVIETGIHAPYLEVWERLPDSTGRFIALAGLNDLGGDSHQRFFVAGHYAMHVRPRSSAWPPGTSAGQSLGDVLAHHPAMAQSLLDFEISFGTLQEGVWMIEQSTLPTLRGTRRAFTVNQTSDTQARIEHSAGAERWQILEWC
jgi:hypothetical protein